MPAKKVKEALEAFHDLDSAQTHWEEVFSELSEKEEAELERCLFAEGVTIKPLKHKEVTSQTEEKK